MDGINQSEQFNSRPCGSGTNVRPEPGQSIETDTSHLAGPRPYWLPPDTDADALPEELRLAIAEILTPAYRELVLEPPTALERATGVTFVYLLWVELLEQCDMGHTIPATAMNGQAVNRQAALDRLLRVIGAKQKAANFLQRIKEWRARPRNPLIGIGFPGRGPNLGKS